MQLFDSHAHLCDEKFDDDRDALAAALPERGVCGVIEVACRPSEFAATLALADQYPYIFPAAGVHPHQADELDQAALDALRRLADEKRIVAIGEIGLDYHYDFCPRELQKETFARQLKLAQEVDMPVILHIREAFGDGMEILRAHRKNLKGVMHCFSGSAEIARECVELGLYVAFGGAITFQNASKLLLAAKEVPAERLLIETDCPYMSPVPFRGKRNDPTLVRLACEKLAELRGVSAEEIAETTKQNAMRLFGVRPC